jgi:hypothetical protein
MATKMTEGLPLNPKLTATPNRQQLVFIKRLKSRRMWHMFCRFGVLL